MTTLFFPDNTVLVRFARIGRMDLLSAIVRTNGAWCGTVAGECARSAQEPGLESMAEARAVFGEPLLLQTQKETLDTIAIRTSLAAPGDPDKAHLGEAETIAIITNRQITGFFVTDDLSAARRAREHGVTTYSTWHILRLAVRIQLLDVNEAYDYVRELGGHRLGYEYLASRARWVHWCATGS